MVAKKNWRNLPGKSSYYVSVINHLFNGTFTFVVPSKKTLIYTELGSKLKSQESDWMLIMSNSSSIIP